MKKQGHPQKAAALSPWRNMAFRVRRRMRGRARAFRRNGILRYRARLFGSRKRNEKSAPRHAHGKLNALSDSLRALSGMGGKWSPSPPSSPHAREPRSLQAVSEATSTPNMGRMFLPRAVNPIGETSPGNRSRRARDRRRGGSQSRSIQEIMRLRKLQRLLMSTAREDEAARWHPPNCRP